MEAINNNSIKIWMLDNELDSFEHIENQARDYNVEFEWFENFMLVKDRLECSSPPDLLLLDLCFSDYDQQVVSSPIKTFEDLKPISRITGVKYLTKFRCMWPKLPIVLISSYINKDDIIRQLSQHAICFINKSEQSIQKTLKIAQKVIIGIRISKSIENSISELSDDIKQNIENITKNTIKELNDLQNHFLFVFYNEDEDLSIPPIEYRSESSKSISVELTKSWNTRVLAVIDDISFINSDKNDKFFPILPFSTNPVFYHPVNLLEYASLMTISYYKPYFIRECIKVIYRLFYKINGHPMDTGRCIFDSSENPSHLLKGIKNGVCNECKSQMTPQYAYGGWSEGRNMAAETIINLAREALIEIEN